MRILAVSHTDPYRTDRVTTSDGDIKTGEGFAIILNREPRGPGGDVTRVQVTDWLERTPARCGEVSPPFAAAYRKPGAHQPVIAVTDWLGFRQLYWWQGPGMAALGTSARELAGLARRGPDHDALGVQSLLGWQLGDATPFAGISKVPAGHYARLHRGRVELVRYDTDRPESGGAAEMAGLLRTWLEEYLDSHDDPVLQLTGGHDSRILLGAIPRGRRAGLRTLTLDSVGGVDAPIAGVLSAKYAMRHEVFDTSVLADLSPAEAHTLVTTAALDLECAANPLALAPLSAAESRLEQGRRLSGLGGEVARGFYYGAQPAGRTSIPLAERFARWRLFTNEAVDSAALVADFTEAARKHTLALVTDQLLGYSHHWPRALDEFYLWQRMQRWAGAHGTVAATSRVFLNPMFDRRFTELARSAAPADKRDSRLLGKIMRELDPELAAIPLDSGRTPNQLAAGRGQWGATARKTFRKVVQRVSGSRRPPLGAAMLSGLVVEHWRSTPDLLSGLPDLVCPSYVAELLDGRRAGDPATVAFLVNLSAVAGVQRR